MRAGANVSAHNQPDSTPKVPLETDLCGCRIGSRAALDVAVAGGKTYVSYSDPDDAFGGVARIDEDGLTRIADVSGRIDTAPDGTVYVATGENITAIGPSGATSVVPGSTGLGDLADVAVDRDGSLVVADWAGSRVLRLAAGKATDLNAGDIGRVYVAVDRSSGAIYLGDIDHQYVYSLVDGARVTLAGTGARGSETVDAPAADSSVYLPHPYVDAAGTLYIGDVSGLYSVDAGGVMRLNVPESRGGLSEVQSAAIDSTGAIYLADSDRLWAMNGFVETGPPATPKVELGDIATSAQVGQDYSSTVSASGGTAPYEYVLSAGAPSWLGIDRHTGALSGVPTEAGPVTFEITATDADGVVGHRSYDLVVSAADGPGDGTGGGTGGGTGDGSGDGSGDGTGSGSSPGTADSSVHGDAVPGGEMTATLNGFAPSTPVAVTLHSAPVALGSFDSGADGSVTVKFTIPRAFHGRHTVTGVGLSPTGKQITVTVAFTVHGQSALPDTGSTISLVMVWLAGLLIAIGGLLVRRRRAA